MDTNDTCQSCAMPVESRIYCSYCTDEKGTLQTFEERLRRLSLFAKQENPHFSDEDAIELSLNFMSQMPAWRNHPELLRRR
ncbi:MAG: hypothetical protein GY732_16465 [Gammaproteobacteria bacterium]|nr:hypothetical protein [Gammaproteobacteria bacterium]